MAIPRMGVDRPALQRRLLFKCLRRRLFLRGSRRMAVQEVSPSTLAEHELELAAREAELNRREAALRRAQESRGESDERTSLLDRREIELEQTLEASLRRADETRRELDDRL